MLGKTNNFINWESNVLHGKMVKFGPTYVQVSNNKLDYAKPALKLLSLGLIIRVLKLSNGTKIYSPLR